MHFSLRGIPFGLAVSGLQYGVVSRALPRAGVHDCDDDSCTAIQYSPPAKVAASTIFASPLYNHNRRALKVARFDIDPVTDPDPVIPSDPTTSDPNLEPVNDGDPTNPQSPGQTDGSGPINPETYVPPKSTGDGQPPSLTNTPPTVIPTDSSPKPTPTENAPTLTPTGKDPSPTATDDQPSPTKTDDATPPDATSGPDATTGDQPPTSDSPGGASGDDSDDAGGFGDSPNDDECLISSRDVSNLQRRCSRRQRPIGWTAYDDMAATNPPIADTAFDALKAAIKDNSKDEDDAPSYHESYFDNDVVGGAVTQNSFNGFFGASIPTKIRDDPFFQSKLDDQYQRTSLKSAVLPGRLNRNKEMHISGFSADRKTIVASFSNADFDTTKHLTWSELAFQRYHELAGSDVNKLESVVRQNVANPDTLNTIRKAYTNMGKVFGEGTTGDKVVFNANAPVGSAEGEAFAALMRTDNVRGVNWMLGDHHRALGDKRITSITVWSSGDHTFMLISVG